MIPARRLVCFALLLPLAALAAPKKKVVTPPKERVVIQVSDGDSKR
jgi:hypothetical protein